MHTQSRPLIVIDPGHGGAARRGRSTPFGVTGPTGTQEKTVNLDLSRRIAARLGGAAQVRMTRSGDANRSISERIGAARAQGARIFLSIHADRRPGERPGPHLWVHDRADPMSFNLAGSLCDSVGDAGAPIHAGPIAVLDPDLHASSTAACLIEVDDLSSVLGERRLRSPEWLDALATEIVRGLQGFLGASAYGRPARAYGNAGELFVPYDQMVRGIDVSHWNGDIDWNQVAGDAIAFAYIKATEGRTFVDNRFATNWADAASAGLPRGAYHVLREPTSSHVDDQVRNFLDHVTHAEGDLPPALDVENQHLRAIVADFRAQGSSRARAREQAREWLLSWLRPVQEAVGMAPILYIGHSSIIHTLARDAGELTNYGLWYPRYRREPNLPEDRDGNIIWPHFTIWQRTSSGSVAGIGGNVDLNLFNGDAAAFQTWRGGTRGRPLSIGGRRPVRLPRRRRRRYGTTGPDVVADEADLRAYVDAISASGAARGMPGDVDKAIAVVGHWQAGHAVFVLSIEAKVGLVQDLLGDPTQAGVEDAVFVLLDGATDNELRSILMEPAAGLETSLSAAFPGRMATLTSSRRNALQWVTMSDEQIAATFSSSRVYELRNVFENNALQADRKDCITIIKNTSATLFGGDATVKAEADAAFSGLPDLRITFYGDEMVRRGLAVHQSFRFAPDNGNSEPTGLAAGTSPWEWVTAQVGEQEGWHVFLVGPFNGYHSATLFVEKRTNAMHVYWADQWTIEATEDLDHASGSTHGFRRYDETGLHAHIEHYTTLWWNKVLSEQNARWEATLHMYKLVSLPPAAATAQMRMRGRAWRGPAPAARRPGAVVQPRPGLYGRVGQARARVLTTDWCLLRHSIIRSAVEMQGAWLDSAGNLIQESDAAVLEHLEAFWRDGVGTGNWQARAQESAQNATPWSAAFVSWVVRNAGATTAMGFDFSGRHMDYIAEALRNRMRNDQDRPFWFFGIGEQAAHPLLPGDIVCMNRSFNGQLTTHSLEGLRRRFWGDDGENANADTTGAAHCDVAIGYQTDSNGQRFIEVIGGNRGHHSGPNAHTVGSALLEVDAAGQLTNPGAHNIFGFVKLIECEQVM